jgi:hypothetical protein
MKTYRAKTAKSWRYPWQVVRLRDDAESVMCSHRSELRAGLCAFLRRHLGWVPEGATFEARRTPERAR